MVRNVHSKPNVTTRISEATGLTDNGSVLDGTRNTYLKNTLKGSRMRNLNTRREREREREKGKGIRLEKQRKGKDEKMCLGLIGDRSFVTNSPTNKIQPLNLQTHEQKQEGK